MKYGSINRFQDFEFHDSVFSLILWDDYRLSVSAKHLIVHRDAAPNHTGTDMEIDEARITFAGFQIRELELEKANKADKGGAFYTEPIIYTYTDEKARSIFEDALKIGFTVLGIGLDEEEYELEGISNSPLFYFTVRFSSWSIEVEWDDFCKAAWYELRRELRKEITLSTPNGDMIAQARIICHDEDVYVLGKKLESPSVFVGITYGGTDLCGYGNDYLWVDAFADLQKKLPEGVKIKCCLTCRHGNMCPFGNKPGEIFCTKDITIKQKSDLFFYTTNKQETEKRARDCTELCECYCEQSDSYFTYNDYFLHLKKSRKS